MKKLKIYQSPLTGTIIVWEKYNRERLLTTNGFSQGVSVGDRSIKKSYWYYQAEQILQACRNKKNPAILWLGLGAGTGPHLVSEKNKNIHQTAIEFDPLIIQAANEYFSLESIPNLTIIHSDAYKEVKKLSAEKKIFHVIVVDIYTNDDPQNGKRSTADDFLKSVVKLITSDGLLIFNRLAHTKEEGDRTKEFISNLKKSFKKVKSVFVKDTRGYQNEVITASGKK